MNWTSNQQPGLIDAPLKPDQTSNEQLWNQQVTESLRVGLGQTGDQSQKFVTWTDLEDAGMIENTFSGPGGSGGGYSPSPVTPPPDLQPPGPLKNVEASGGMTAIYIIWDNPLLSYNYYIEVHKASEDDVGKAVLIGTTNGNIYEHLVGSDTSLYYFWVRVIKQTGGVLVIGPWQGTNGASAAAAQDPEWLLEQLEDRISETELNDKLNSEIDKIEPIETSVGDIKEDINTIDTSIGDIKDDIKVIDLDISALETGLNSEVTERQTQDESLHTLIETNVSRIDGNAAAIVTESTTRVTEDEAIASEITTLKSEVDGNTAAIQTESTARATEDEAIASQITTLNADVGGNSAALQSEIETRASEDEAVGKRVDSIAVNVGDNAAAIQTESEARATEDEAIASEITTLRTDVAGNEAAIQSESKTRSDADGAQATQIDTLTAKTGENEAAIQTEQEARTTEDEAQAKQIDSLVVKTGENEAAIQTEQNARTTADEAQATQIETLIAETGDNKALILDEKDARTTADSAHTSQITQLQASVGDNNALIKDEKDARIEADSALVSSVETLQLDLGTTQGSIETHSGLIGDLEDDVAKIGAEYSVKLDVDGYVGGFGIINQDETITALWRVDVFAVGAPGSDSLTFAIDTEADQVVMSGAYIQDASITDAKIGSLTVDKLIGGTSHWVNSNIENASITNAKIGNYIQSDNYATNTAGWIINKAGYAEFSDIKARGLIEGSIIRGSVIEGGILIQSDVQITTPTEADRGAGTIRYLSTATTTEQAGELRLSIYSANYTGDGYTNYGEGEAKEPVYTQFNRYVKYNINPEVFAIAGGLNDSADNLFRIDLYAVSKSGGKTLLGYFYERLTYVDRGTSTGTNPSNPYTSRTIISDFSWGRVTSYTNTWTEVNYSSGGVPTYSHYERTYRNEIVINNLGTFYYQNYNYVAIEITTNFSPSTISLKDTTAKYV